MEEWNILPEQVETKFDGKFIRVYDLQYAPGQHYFDASRRVPEELVAVKNAQEAKEMLPDAVSCVVILCLPNEEPKLLLTYEYRYPAGRYLLSVPAGLIDPEDRLLEEPLLATAKREIEEETGIQAGPDAVFRVINPFAYSTPGMSDESNALVSVVLPLENTNGLNQEGCVGSEKFDGFELVTQEEAKELLAGGRDKYGNFYSMYTWAALVWFVTGSWKNGI